MKTLSQIARELGVSKAAVSYVYHDKWKENRIGPSLAARIKKKLQEEHARPDMLGQQLRLGLTHTAGVVLPNLNQHYFLRLLGGLETRLSEDNYMLFLGNSQRETQCRQKEILERMIARRVDIIILSPVATDDFADLLERIRSRNIRIIFVDNYVSKCDLPYVVSANRWGATQAVRHLLAANRSRVAFTGDSQGTAVVADRYSGYVKTLRDAGIRVRKEHVLWQSELAGDFEEAFRQMLKSPHRPDALFCSSLTNSHEMIRIMSELGLRHPNDLLLSGFDFPIARMEAAALRKTIRAPFLTVRQEAEAMGIAAAEMALALINNQLQKKSQTIRPTLTWEDWSDSDKGAIREEKAPLRRHR